MIIINEFPEIKGQLVEPRALEQQRIQEILYSNSPKPEYDLPRYFFGFKKQPNQSTPSAWRETFELERDTATDVLSKKIFEQLIQLADIAEECRATHLLFKSRTDYMPSGRAIHVLYLDKILFRKDTMIEDMNNFCHKLIAIGS